jgi:hypothetical protein
MNDWPASDAALSEAARQRIEIIAAVNTRRVREEEKRMDRIIVNKEETADDAT